MTIQQCHWETHQLPMKVRVAGTPGWWRLKQRGTTVWMSTAVVTGGRRWRRGDRWRRVTLSDVGHATATVSCSQTVSARHWGRLCWSRSTVWRWRWQSQKPRHRRRSAVTTSHSDLWHLTAAASNLWQALTNWNHVGGWRWCNFRISCHSRMSLTCTSHAAHHCRRHCRNFWICNKHTHYVLKKPNAQYQQHALDTSIYSSHLPCTLIAVKIKGLILIVITKVNHIIKSVTNLSCYEVLLLLVRSKQSLCNFFCH